jgi:rSAM/selenodomain-associated transferase 1
MRPTVIVFAKAPVEGLVKTRLGLPPADAAALHRRFVEATLRTCLSLEAGCELHTDQPCGDWAAFSIPRAVQAIGDLGERMLAVLQSRPLPVMIVGSDAPTLPLDHLRALLAAQADVALGPARDGGYYAILCRRAHPRMFDDVPWSTGETLDRTRAAALACGLSVELGPSWFDVDTLDDLRLLPPEFVETCPELRHLRSRIWPAASRHVVG